jgi:hypothetical protein
MSGSTEDTPLGRRPNYTREEWRKICSEIIIIVGLTRPILRVVPNQAKMREEV